MSPTGPSRLGSSIAVLPAPVQPEPVKGTFLLCSKVTFSYCCDIVQSHLSPQSDNVLFVPNRNVLLTEARWGVGNGPTPDDAERARPAGRALDFGQKSQAAAAKARDFQASLKPRGARTVLFSIISWRRRARRS